VNRPIISTDGLSSRCLAAMLGKIERSRGSVMTVSRHLLALALLCATPVVAACSAGAASGAAQSPAGLDVITVTITSGTRNHEVQAEVARTAAEQARGLMNRSSLAEGAGMLFPFAEPKFASFWMRNTLIPLDIIFIRQDGTIDRIAENTVPHDETPVVSGGMVSAVLEIPGGTSARLGIDESATVRWDDAR
jgi:uncharacterized protein